MGPWALAQGGVVGDYKNPYKSLNPWPSCRHIKIDKNGRRELEGAKTKLDREVQIQKLVTKKKEELWNKWSQVSAILG